MSHTFYSVSNLFFDKLTYFIGSDVTVNEQTPFPLHDAVYREDILMMFKYLKSIPIDQAKPCGRTALIEATSKPLTWKNRMIIKFLLMRGADPLIQSAGRSAAYNIFERKDMDLIIDLLKYIKDANAPVSTNEKLLDVSMRYGNYSIARKLLQMGASPFKIDPVERTFLHQAVSIGNVGLVRMFLKAGIDINSRDPLGRTPLHYAVLSFSIECLKEILANQPDIDAVDIDGCTAINLGLKDGWDFSMMEHLLKYKPNVNIADSEGNTPLHNMFTSRRWWIMWGILELLIEAGAKVNAKNKRGNTPLHLVVTKNKYEGLENILIHNGADVNITNAEGKTPLHVSLRKHRFHSMLKCSLLLEKQIGKKVIGTENMRLIANNIYLKEYRERCILELNELDIFRPAINCCEENYWKSEKALRCLRKREMREALRSLHNKEFPIYGGCIRYMYIRNLRRGVVEELVLKYLMDLYGNVLPQECVEMIFSHFSEKDLQIFLDKYWNRHDRKRSLEIIGEISELVIWPLYVIEYLLSHLLSHSTEPMQ